MQTGYGYSALHAAVISHDLQKLTSLLKDRYNPDVKDAMDFAPLHVATLKGSKDVVEVLIAAGCDVNSFTKEEMTSLHLAAEHNSANDILQVLVSVSCDVNARNKVGRTALHLAAKRGNLPHLRVLLDSGCDRRLKDKFGVTAVGVAIKFGQTECVDFLLHYEPRKKSEKSEDVIRRNDSGDEDVYGSCETAKGSGLARYGSRDNCKLDNGTRNDIAVDGRFDARDPSLTRHSDDCARNGATETIRRAKQIIAIPERNGAKAGISKELLHLMEALVSWKRDTLDKTLDHVPLCVACKISPDTYFVESKLLDGILALPFTQAPLTTAPYVQSLCLGPSYPRKLKASHSSALSTLCLRDLQRSSGRQCHLVVLHSDMRMSMNSHSLHSRLHLLSTDENRRCFSLPSNRKSQRQSSLYDVNRFAQVFVKLCTRALTHPKAVERILDSMFTTVFSKKIFELDVLADTLLKQIAVASAESQAAEYRNASADKCYLAGVILNLEYVVNAAYTPTNFLEAILEALLSQVEIFNFVLDERATFFRLLIAKILEDENKQWNTDKASTIFLQTCDKTKQDRSLLVKVGRAMLSQTLTQPCCNGLSLVTGILIRMGLLKGEGCVISVQDLSAPLIALEHVFREDFFPRTLVAVFASFLAKPNPALGKFQELRLRALKAAVMKEVCPQTANEACEAFGEGFKRVCDALTPEGFWEIAEDCCDALASKAWDETSSQAWRAGEALLVSLGLMKSEIKTEPVRNTQSALKLLRHMANQPYFPQLLVPMFRLFLRKPNPRLESCQESVDDVLKSLQDK